MTTVVYNPESSFDRLPKDFVPRSGQLVFDESTGELKVADGKSIPSALPSITSGSSGGGGLSVESQSSTPKKAEYTFAGDFSAGGIFAKSSTSDTAPNLDPWFTSEDVDLSIMGIGTIGGYKANQDSLFSIQVSMSQTFPSETPNDILPKLIMQPLVLQDTSVEVISTTPPLFASNINLHELLFVRSVGTPQTNQTIQKTIMLPMPKGSTFLWVAMCTEKNESLVMDDLRLSFEWTRLLSS